MTVATPSEKLSLDWITLGFIVFLHLAALLALVPSNFSWPAIGLAIFLHWLTGCFGITLGFHRLVSHRSFQTPKWLEYFFVFCGALSCQGGVIDWVGMHRMHHLYSDTDKDPHDSHKGFWWSHIGWMIYKIPSRADIAKFTKDISDDPFYKFCQNYFIPIQVVFGLLLYFLGGWPFVVWAVFVRIVALFHCTWFVNSATHQFGYRTHECNDTSRNCWWVAAVTYGEGWHNNHHACQYSARHGWAWWELDPTWSVIRSLELLGLATKVKLMDAEATS